MRRYKNILVAVDGSEAGFHALVESIRLAQWGKGGAAVIHVAPFYEGDLSLVGVKNIKATVNGLGGAILQEAMNIAERHDFLMNTILARGEIHESIARHALTADVDLIVLGARRTSFIAGLFAGRVLREVIALSFKDVLVIPDQMTIGWEKVLFPVDSSKNDVEIALRVVEVARAYGAELSVLSVMKPFFNTRGRTMAGNDGHLRGTAAQYLESIRIQAERASLRSESKLVSGRFSTMVSKTAREEHASMIAIGLQKRTGFGWSIGRSPITRIVYSSPCPVLLLRSSTC
jgi:nucleotide-binding universal stress UspA family protein